MATKKGKKLITVDFTGVDAGSAGKLLPEGPTQFEVDEIEQKVSDNSGEPYLAITLKVMEGEENAGVKAWDNMSLQPQALWKLRGFLDACGIETVDGEMDLDPDEIIGLVVTGDVVHEEYKGKTKHRIAGYSPIEEAKPKASAKTATAKKKPAKVEEPEEEKEEWKVKQKVAFMDGKKRIEGTISDIDGDTITVRVGKEEYEMGPDDLEAA